VVERRATEVKANPINLRSLVELGYTITSLDMRPSGQASTSGFVIKYDFTLWILGNAATMARFAAVTYARPTPFASTPVSSTSPHRSVLLPPSRPPLVRSAAGLARSARARP
jgi:hypothetical protein